MNSKTEEFDQCLALAGRIVAAYRAEAPEGCDPQNTFINVAAVTTIVGAGVSIAGGVAVSKAQKAQGETANAIAHMNARNMEINAMMGLIAAKAEEKLRKRIAEAEFRLRKIDADARFNNAVVLENTAHVQSRAARESIRRISGERERLQGTQRAVIGHSGLTESGTPLDVLAETAAAIQLEREDAQHADELNRRGLFREAQLERYGGKVIMAGATMDRSIALAESKLRLAAGQAAYRSQLRDAELTRLSGGAEQQSYNAAARASLFGGITQGVSALGGVRFGK